VTTPVAIEIVSRDASETARVGQTLAGWLRDGDVVLLHGDLGAGKTTLAKGIAAGLGIDDVVSSPSFALVNEYQTGRLAPVSNLFHLDLYRLASDEIDSIGFADYASPTAGVTLIEWPERALALLPDRYLLIELEITGPEQRRLRLSLSPAAAESRARLDELRERFRNDGDQDSVSS
jgi:tRNA threonylcarbamoyladenosine biosynthesis protein TsaE